MVDTGDSVGAAMVEPAEENSRPKRVRKQNVRYSPEEYDLSVVSVSGLEKGGNPKKLKHPRRWLQFGEMSPVPKLRPRRTGLVGV